MGIYKIEFNEKDKGFIICKIKKQYLSHSKKEINLLFKRNFEAVNSQKAENKKDYIITELFGSTQLNYFKIKEV